MTEAAPPRATKVWVTWKWRSKVENSIALWSLLPNAQVTQE
jgi:hypothetical protein